MDEIQKITKIHSKVTDIISGFNLSASASEQTDEIGAVQFQSLPLSQALIWQEEQFSRMMGIWGAKRYCLSDSKRLAPPYPGRQVIIILTTQRSGSTLLCEDLSCYLDLQYKPTETFIPVLKNYLSSSSEMDEQSCLIRIAAALDNAISYPVQEQPSAPVVHKLMIDYLGWLAVASGVGSNHITYQEKCLAFLRWLLKDCAPCSKIIILKRAKLASQAISRFINSMGFETHLTSQESRCDFEKKVADRLATIDCPEHNVLEHASILIKQYRLIDRLRGHAASIANVELLEMHFEDDMIKRFPAYLQDLGAPVDKSLESVVRSLVPTSGANNSFLKDALHNLLF